MKLLKLFLCLSFLFIFCGGCATTKSHSSKSRWFPSPNKLKRAAIDAATQPSTWIPAAGAVALSVGNADKKLSKWASSNTPVFGSQDSARTASDNLRNASELGFDTTILALALDDKYEEASTDALIGLGVQVSALNIVNETTSYLKAEVARERPFGGNFSSFPSRHSSSAFAHTTLAKRNLDLLDLSPKTRKGLSYGLTALSIGTAWGRVEGNVHYPTDVLAGAALANFTTHFLFNAFLDDKSDVRISVEPEKDGGKMKIELPF